MRRWTFAIAAFVAAIVPLAPTHASGHASARTNFVVSASWGEE
jgi:hypothetical protein